jgi:hypothetical protein
MEEKSWDVRGVGSTRVGLTRLAGLFHGGSAIRKFGHTAIRQYGSRALSYYSSPVTRHSFFMSPALARLTAYHFHEVASAVCNHAKARS